MSPYLRHQVVVLSYSWCHFSFLHYVWSSIYFRLHIDRPRNLVAWLFSPKSSFFLSFPAWLFGPPQTAAALVTDNRHHLCELHWDSSPCMAVEVWAVVPFWPPALEKMSPRLLPATLPPYEAPLHGLAMYILARWLCNSCNLGRATRRTSFSSVDR